MTDQLLEKIRDHANAEPVPELDLDGIILRGRRVRRRRTVARRGVVGLVVTAVAGTALVVGTGHDSPPTRLDVSTSISSSDVDLVSAAYRKGGAYSRGHTLWFSDPTYSVDVGTTIQMMLYTADGVVAGVSNNDAGDVKRDYVYVGTDGSVRDLELPGKIVPGTDAQADRLAYLTTKDDGYEIHVVEASTGRELATHDYDATYTWAGWDVPPIGLTGDYVVIGVDSAQQVVDWRTGERVKDVPGTRLPSVGGGRALGGPLGDVIYRVGDSRKLRSTTELSAPSEPAESHRLSSSSLSPDGRFVTTANTFVQRDDKGRVEAVTDGATGEVIDNPVISVTDVGTGQSIALPGHASTYGWTPDGRLMRVDGTNVTSCDASSGECTSTSVPSGKGTIRMAGRYIGS